jgi:hypothetical protein
LPASRCVTSSEKEKGARGALCRYMLAGQTRSSNRPAAWASRV